MERNLSAKDGLTSLIVFNPEFVVAGLYVVSASTMEAVKAVKGIKSERSVALGCTLILVVGSFFKANLVCKIKNKQEEEA